MCLEEGTGDSRRRALLCLAMRARTRRWRRLKRSLGLLVIARPLFLLAFLAADMLGGVFDALALVGLGLAEGADHRRRLPDPLPIGAGNEDRGRLLAGDLDVAGDREDDVVAVAQLQHQVLALDRRTVSDALDLQVLGEALGHAGDHVVDEGAHRAPMDSGALVLALRLHQHLAVLHQGGHLAAHRQLERAELALGGDGLPRHLDGDARRGGYGGFADTRHLVTSEHAAEDVAGDIGGPGLVIRHHAARRRQDGDAQPVIDARQVGDLGIDAPARLRHAGDLADHRLAVDIFELDLELGDALTYLLARVAADIALALQHFQHRGADLGRRRLDDGLVCLLPVANAGQHIAERIGHRHALCLPYQLDLTMPGIWPAEASSRSAMRESLNLR